MTHVCCSHPCTRSPFSVPDACLALMLAPIEPKDLVPCSPEDTFRYFQHVANAVQVIEQDCMLLLCCSEALQVQVSFIPATSDTVTALHACASAVILHARLQHGLQLNARQAACFNICAGVSSMQTPELRSRWKSGSTFTELG